MPTIQCFYRPLGWTKNGRPIWPIAGGNGDNDPPSDPPGDPKPNDPPADPPPDPKPDKGFPDDTPVAEMTAEQQAAYWKHHARRHEERAKARGDYDDLKAKAAKYDELERQQMSDADKAKADADNARAELAAARAQMVDAHISAAVTAGRITQDQADRLLATVDRSTMLNDDGSVDTDTVTGLIDAMTPPGMGNGDGRRFPDLGQGRRHGKPKPSIQSGRDAYQQRHGANQPASQ